MNSASYKWHVGCNVLGMKAKHLEPKTYKHLLDFLAKNRKEDTKRLLIELIALTGCRTQEALQVEAKDINTTDGLVFIRAVKGSEDRNAPVPKDFAHALKAHLEAMGHKDNYETQSRKLREAWTRLRNSTLGLGHGHCSLHGLRASYAVLMLETFQNNALIVKELLGHKELNSTGRYLRLTQAASRHEDILAALTKK